MDTSDPKHPDNRIPWTEEFAWDIALGAKSSEEVCQDHKILPKQYDALRELVLFNETVRRYHHAQQDEASAIKYLARATMKGQFKKLSAMMSAQDTPPNIFLECFKMVTDLGGLGKNQPPESTGAKAYLVDSSMAPPPLTEAQESTPTKFKNAAAPSFEEPEGTEYEDYEFEDNEPPE